MKKEMRPINTIEATDFLLPKHYSGRIPQISKAFGWYKDGKLKAVCTFGKPVNPYLCDGICGKEYSASVYELNRLCRTDDFKEPLSKFVSWCLRKLKPMNWIIVSYSDTAMNHHGYIYQATNFLYTGCTKKRTDPITPSGKHHRHYTEQNTGFRKVRSAKHRYVYFCSKSKTLKKEWMKHLKYPIEKYPKGDNTNYILGNYAKDVILKDEEVVDGVGIDELFKKHGSSSKLKNWLH